MLAERDKIREDLRVMLRIEVKVKGDGVGEEDDAEDEVDVEVEDDGVGEEGDVVDDDENDSDDSECSQEESLSNFSKMDDNEPELFGNSGTVDGEAIANDLRGLDEHVDEPFHLADGQNHDGMAPAAGHEDVLEESSTAHEAYMDAMKLFGF